MEGGVPPQAIRARSPAAAASSLALLLSSFNGLEDHLQQGPPEAIPDWPGGSWHKFPPGRLVPSGGKHPGQLVADRQPNGGE